MARGHARNIIRAENFSLFRSANSPTCILVVRILTNRKPFVLNYVIPMDILYIGKYVYE